jgi:hypothetical protein
MASSASRRSLRQPVDFRLQVRHAALEVGDALVEVREQL